MNCLLINLRAGRAPSASADLGLFEGVADDAEGVAEIPVEMGVMVVQRVAADCVAERAWLG